MSGHSKWSKIKRKKAATDEKKSREFGRAVRDIRTALRDARGDATNAGVIAAINKARSLNVPKENIERVIKRASGDGVQYTEALYEFYGPGGAAIVVRVQTDNTNRTSAAVRHLLSERGFELAAPGSALWAFSNNSDGSLSPATPVTLSPKDWTSLSSLREELLDNEDVADVYTNAKQ